MNCNKSLKLPEPPLTEKGEKKSKMAAEQEDAARPRTNSNIRVYREQLPLRENYGLNEQLRNNKQEKATQHKRLGNLLRGYPPGAAETLRELRKSPEWRRREAPFVYVPLHIHGSGALFLVF